MIPELEKIILPPKRKKIIDSKQIDFLENRIKILKNEIPYQKKKNLIEAKKIRNRILKKKFLKQDYKILFNNNGYKVNMDTLFTYEEVLNQFITKSKLTSIEVERQMIENALKKADIKQNQLTEAEEEINDCKKLISKLKN